MARAGRPMVAPDRLRQGQVIRNLYEYIPTGLPTADGPAEVTAVLHPLVVVLSPECDLVSDYELRNANPKGGVDRSQSSSFLEHIQCCKLFEEGEIRGPHRLNSAAWSFIKTNRHERYHTIPASAVGRSDSTTPLYSDFKRIFGVSTEYLYAALDAGQLEMDAVIAPPWIHQLVQRCYAFQARVCVPDPADQRPSARQ